VAHVPMEERRRQFLDATVKVIAEEGVARATTRRIAEVAGAPAASLHYCYDTKEELFQAVFDHGTTWGLAEAGRDVTRGMGLHAAVEAITRGYLRWMLNSRSLQMVFYELALWAMHNPVNRRHAERSYRSYIDRTIQFLREAKTADDGEADLEYLARQIIATLDGNGLQWMALDDGKMSFMVETAIKGIQCAIPAQLPAADAELSS
jgi:AcrR family transcriptional regulator